MNDLALAHTQRIAALSQIRHGNQAEDAPLVIQESNQSTGGLSELVTIPAGAFTFSPTQNSYDGHNDSSTAHLRTLQVAKDWLTESVAKKTLVVEWQGTRYRLEVDNKPESLNQYWQFLAVPSELL